LAELSVVIIDGGPSSLWQQHRLQRNLNLLGQSKQWDVTKQQPHSSLAESMCMFLLYNHIRNCDCLLLLKIYQMTVWVLFIIMTSVGCNRLLSYIDALQVILYVEIILLESVI